MDDRLILGRLAVAVLGGLAVGIEREWSAGREGSASRFGGVRTFLLLGLLGGLAAPLAVIHPALGAGLLAFGGGLVAIAYWVSARQGAIDATTEVAGGVVLAAGTLAGYGSMVLASAVFAATALVLAEKSRMHDAVRRIESSELIAGARFAVLALVVLPLLPQEPLAILGGLEIRRLWILVLLFAGVSFGGFVALRIGGPERGWGLAGLLGGLVSSTVVTLNFARESRVEESAARALARGALAASSVLPVRVLLLTLVLAPALARTLLPPLLPVLAVSALFVALAVARRSRETVSAALLPKNPLRLGSAIQMALFFAVVLAALSWVRDRFGEGGLIGTSALLGLTDLDALTYSVSELSSRGTAVELGARALVVGMIANTVFKSALALVLGAPAYRRVCGAGLSLTAVALAAGLFLLR